LVARPERDLGTRAGIQRIALYLGWSGSCRVRQREPAFLERLVLAVLTAMGYGGAAGAAEHLGKSGDEGLDGVIRQDPLGLDRIYVQAKRYGVSRAAGRPEIQEFVYALHGA
jgi:restriction system protein